MKHILPLILALIMLFSLPSCTSPQVAAERVTQETTARQEYNYYIGNKNTKKYHRPDCSYLPDADNQVRIRANQVGRGTYKEYKPCKHCNP